MKRSPRKNERGIALIMVLLLIALLGSVVADFQFNSRVELQLAINARDELQAEYNAFTALKMRALLLKNSAKLKSAAAGVQAATGIPTDSMMPINQLLEMVPVECGLLGTIMQAAEDPFADVADLEEEAASGEGDGFFRGECIATSTSEHSKISLSQLGRISGGLDLNAPDANTARRNQNAGRSAASMLVARYSRPAR